MKKCPNCGGSNADSVTECLSCGYALPLLSPEDEVGPDTAVERGEELPENDNLIILEQAGFSEEPSTALTEQQRKAKKKKQIIILSIVGVVFVLFIVFGIILSKVVAEQKLVTSVENDITNIGTVQITNECKGKIDTAIDHYNALSDKQKLKVKNYATLTKANSSYNSLLYYNTLTVACNFVHKKATVAMEILNDIKTVWGNVIYSKKDEYNQGNYDFDTAMNNYWGSVKYLESSMLLYDDTSKDDNGRTLKEYLTALKNPPEQYKSAYDAFTALYASYSAMVPMTRAVNHTYSTFSSEVSTLSTDYKSQHGKAKALIPEMN